MVFIINYIFYGINIVNTFIYLLVDEITEFPIYTFFTS